MNIVFSGGDMRMKYAGDYLEKYGYTPLIINSEIAPLSSANKYYELARLADILILPAPLSVDKIHIKGTSADSDGVCIDMLFESAKEDAMIFTGNINGGFLKPRQTHINYLEDEDYLLDSAYLTAEGTVGHLLSSYPRALKDRRILLIGNGRIATYLYKQLCFYSKKISIVLRNEEKLRILREQGISANNFAHLPTLVNCADIIINTVPSLVLTKDILINIKKSTYIIDLASMPGGVDFKIADEFGLSALHLLALPGKCAPVSSGAALAKVILKHIHNQ